MGKPLVIEYVTTDPRVRGWWTDGCVRTGLPMVATATLIRDLFGEPWLVEAFGLTIKDVRDGEAAYWMGRYGGLRGIRQYGTLCRARQMVMGGNGHVSRGHTSITFVRRMSRPNILALTMAPSLAVTPELIRAPWALRRAVAIGEKR